MEPTADVSAIGRGGALPRDLGIAELSVAALRERI